MSNFPAPANDQTHAHDLGPSVPKTSWYQRIFNFVATAVEIISPRFNSSGSNETTHTPTTNITATHAAVVTVGEGSDPGEMQWPFKLHIRLWYSSAFTANERYICPHVPSPFPETTDFRELLFSKPETICILRYQLMPFDSDRFYRRMGWWVRDTLLGA